MSYRMCARIVFPATRNREELTVSLVNSVKIESSWKQLTDTAEVVLPKKIRILSGQKFDEIFKAGDPVRIELGYNKQLHTEFTGYLKRVSCGIPVTLLCEDEMYKLKRNTVSVSIKNAKLEDLLKKIAPGYETDCYEGVELGTVRYTNVTAAQVLEDIQKKTGLRSYFDGKVLRCGKIYADQENIKPVKIELERNAISESLNQNSASEYEIKVKAISLLKGGKKIEAEAGDSNGTLQTLTYVGIEAKAVLKKMAEKDYKRLKAKGFDGKIELFGIPRVQHGMRVELQSRLCRDYNGTYVVDSVTKEFGDNATYRQSVELGNKLE